MYKRRPYVLGNSTAGKLHKLQVPAVLPLGKESFIQIVIILTGLSYSVPQYRERERGRHRERERERESVCVEAVAVSLKNYVSNLRTHVGYKQHELFIIYTFVCRASTCFFEHTTVPLCHLVFLYAV